jgi:cytochrome c553
VEFFMAKTGAPSMRNKRTATGWSRGIVGMLFVATLAAPHATGADDNLEFFEAKVRPLLASRCYKCHSTDKGKTHGGLSLDSRDGWQKGGENGTPIVPGKPDESLLIQAVRYGDDSPQMPPEEAGGKLSDDEIAILTQWVKLGAPDPREPNRRSKSMTPDDAKTWWAFQPLKPVTPPPVADRREVRGVIDEFLQAGIEKAGLTPLPAADKRTLLRRATFDLIGLPPSPEEVADFLSDDSPNAFAKVVDRLLASPHYGERYGRHWLDLVRYADYFQQDPKEHAQAARFELFEAWRYRDWVVAAFNRDLPFDQFVVHQIAGDRLASADGQVPYADGLVATGVLAIGAWDNGDADKQHVVADIVDDQINLVGQTFLGLTLACARCHDHKFDPITADDYYALAGIFYSTHVLSGLGEQGGHTALLRTPLAAADYLDRRREQLARIAELDAELAKLKPPAPQPPVAGSTAPAAAPQPAADPLPVDSVALIDKLRAERAALQSKLLPEPALAITAQDGGTPGGLFPQIQDVPLHIQGNHNKLGKVVARRFPVVLAGADQPPLSTGSGRVALAHWIADPANPLTPRVMINRIWQWHFGDGFTRTPSNFGKLGDKPASPELLDWLAGQFVSSGWSVKAMHRLIMNSAAYRRTSAIGALDAEEARLFEQDPENRLLARFSPRRLEAECLRDAMLAAGGRLDRTLGGPAALDLSLPRRSLYVQTTRWARPYFSSLFDAADPEQLVDHRSISTTAPQALFFLNHPFVAAISGQIVESLMSQAADNPTRVERAYELLFARRPTAAEAQLAVEFFDRSASRGDKVSWSDFVQVLLASNEFAYVD